MASLFMATFLISHSAIRYLGPLGELAQQWKHMHRHPAILSKRLDCIEDEAIAEIDEVGEAPQGAKLDANPYVISYDGEGSYHKVVIANTNDPSEWITKCGWRFAMSPHKRSKEVPEDLHFERLCDRCLKQLRKDHMARTLSADPAHEEEAASSDSSA